MKRKDKVVSIQFGKSRLLVDDRAGCDLSPRRGVLFDGFERIQVRSMLLSHEVNSRICSRSQGAQELVVIEARGTEGTVGINGASGSLEKGDVSERLIANQTGRIPRTHLHRTRPQMNE